MKVRDPKRIIMPNEAPSNVDIAVQEMRQKEAMENNPFIRMIRDMQQQISQVSAQQQVLMIRLQALTDYMAQAGLLLHQEVDDRGVALGHPYTPEITNTSLFEGLSDEHVIEMPRYGYTAYFAEYSVRTKFIAGLLSQHQAGNLEFSEVIKHVRAFNEEAGRLVPFGGLEFGLISYLNDNPDKLTDEELIGLGTEFGLRKEEELEATQESEESELSVEESPQTEEDQDL